MTTRPDPKSSEHLQPSDSDTSAASSFHRKVNLDDERTTRHIQELKRQRDQILGQVIALRALPSLPHPSIERALDDFINFFTGYTEYFVNLLPDQVSGHDRTYESVLNRALDNTRQLWEQLSLAINQRYNPVYSKNLEEADTKAARILGQVGTIVKGMPILYFDKMFQISRHPYQTYPLLGISLDRFRYDSDAALAHELGHHVFWNNGELEEYAARLDFIDEQIARIILSEKFPDVDFANPAATQRAIRSRFDQYSIWVGWIEEVFADVFGTLITGPKFAKSAQDVLIRERLGRPRDLIVSDGEHPMPALRPFIATSTLEAITDRHNGEFGADLNELIEQLNTRWQPIWAEALKEETQGVPAESGDGHLGHAETNELPAVTLEGLRKQIKPMVQLILEAEFVPDIKAQKKQPEKLLTMLNYWGKEPTANDFAEIWQLQKDLADDPISSIADRIGKRTTGREVEPVPKEKSLFGRFLTFVEKRRGQMGAQPTEASEVWPAVLEFDLALNHGYHSDCQSSHSHPCRHKHVLPHQKALCC